MNNRRSHGIIKLGSIPLAIALASLLASCTNQNQSEGSWKPREIAIMAISRCLYTGGHMSRNEVTKFLAQVNQEQGGQFQRVYESAYTGVSEDVNTKVEKLIREGHGCRRMLTDFVNSEPETDFKKQIAMDWLLRPIKYNDEK